MSPGKRFMIAKNKGYLSSAGPQSRFIIFLLIILVAYTMLLRVFQKLAEIVGLSVFLPISLVTLLIFIGIVGTLYSHKFMGPMLRIRKVLEQMADGDLAVSLRLRESDDPTVKELAKAIRDLSDHNRKNYELIQAAAEDLFDDINTVKDRMRQGAPQAEIGGLIDNLQKAQETLERAIKTLRRA